MPTAAVSDNPADRILQDYTHFLVEQRGLSQATVVNYVPVARRLWKAGLASESSR